MALTSWLFLYPAAWCVLPPVHATRAHTCQFSLPLYYIYRYTYIYKLVIYIYTLYTAGARRAIKGPARLAPLAPRMRARSHTVVHSHYSRVLILISLHSAL